MHLPFTTSRRVRLARLLSTLFLLWLPLLGWGQAATIVNYDFNAGATYTSLSPALAPNVTSAASSTEAFVTYGGTTSGPNAFTANATAGTALGMANSSGTNAKYFQFQLGGTALNTYGSYKIYLQAQRSNAGAQVITVGYSTNGTSYSNLATTYTVPTSFGETVIDLSSITALSNQASIYIRLFASGASGAGTLRVDNLQVQAIAGTSTTPRLTPSPTTLASFTTTQGTASASQSYTLAGANLPADGSIRVALPASSGYEVSSDNVTFGQTARLDYTGTALPTGPTAPTVYVRLAAATAAGTYNSVAIANTVFDNANVAMATTATVTASGSVSGLSASPAALTGFSTTQGIASAAQSYVLAGINITASVLVTAATGYEVSQTSATTGFAATQTVSAANATAGRTIYVRLAASAVAGGNYGTANSPVRITNNGGTNLAPSVAVDGEVTPRAPSLLIAGTLAAFNTLPNAPSAAQSYTLTGSDLTADVTVTAPAGFEVSQTSASAGFATTQTVMPTTSNSVSATIYVRLAATATAGPVSGSITNASAGATARTVAATGTVVGEPATAPTIAASAVAASTVTLTLSNNSGTNYLVVVRPFGTAAVAPTDGTTYAASPAYGAASTTGPGNFVVLAGTTATVNVTGLSSSTRYAADVYAYNVGTAAGFENYLATAGTTDFTTTTGPLLTYKTTGLSGSTGSLVVNTFAANSSASSVTRTGVAPVSTSNAYVSSGFPAAGSGVDPTKYLGFSYAPDAGYTLSITSVQIALSRSSSGATSAELRASTDGTNFTNPILLGSTAAISDATTAGTQFTFSSNTSALQGIAGTVYFRLYAYGGTSNTRISDANASTPAIQVNGTISVGTPVPEINLAQGAASIASTTGSYAFATTVVGGSTAATQFDIQNQGNAVLNLTGTPVVGISGNTADFTLSQPSAATVAAGASAPFTLAFAPTSAGTKTVTIAIANDDSDENPYTFTVTGTGVLAPVLTSFTPATGPVGTMVTLTGTDFTAATTVAFNGTAATAVTFNSTTSLTATVPTGATTGTIAVANAYGTSTSTASFTVVATPTAGTLLVEDNFAYASGEKLTDHGWTGYSGNAGTLVTTVAGNLTQAQYPRGFDPTVAASFAGSSTVRLIGQTTSGQDVYRAFTPSTGTTTYATALVNVNSAVTSTNGANDSYFLSFYNTASGTASPDLRGRVFVKASGTSGIVFGLSLNASVATYAPTVYSINTPYLLVLKYTATGATNTASLFVYSGAADVAEPAVATFTITGPVSASLGPLNAIVLRQDENDVSVDGVRVGSGWGTAIGRPVYVDEVATLSAGNYYSLTATGPATRITTSGTALLEGNLNLNGGKVVTSAASLLTLRPGVTTQVDASGASFVDGPLGRQSRTAGSLFFPIGRSAAYRPLTLNIATAPAGDADGVTTYAASQTEGMPADQTLTGALKRISRVRYYSITPTPAVSAFAGTVELSFGADDAVTDPSLASFVVAKSDGAGWNDLDRSANTSTSLTSGTFTGFSNFILASTIAETAVNPLPVTLTSFGATRQASGAVQVAWATASEKHSAYFEVQRSLDGHTFAVVAKVAAQGTTTQVHTYATPDQQAPAAKLYYRLRQVDTDGTDYFSSVVTLAATEAAATLVLYPNPAHTYLTVAAAAGEQAQVIDLAGRTLQTTTLPASGQLNVEALPAGTYLLRVSLGGQPRTLRFTKE